MDIKQFNKMVMYLFAQGETRLNHTEKKEFDHYLQKNGSFIYSHIFFEYTQLDIEDKQARRFLEYVIENKAEIEEKLGRPLDFRVVFLDYLIRNLKQIEQASEPRIIEAKILRNLNNLIVKDELTELYNFRHYKLELEKEFSRARRNKGCFSLVILDLDDFKLYNDSFGHHAGNQVLRRIGELILQTVRKIDIACRYGGEEFALILPQTSSAGGFILVERLRKCIAQQQFKQRVTISGGLATYPDDTQAIDRSLFEFADKALYHSKEQGKNKITAYADLKSSTQPVKAMA